MLDLDLAPRIAGAAPFRNRRGHRGRDEALQGEDADQRVDHGLGHGEAEQRRVDADARRIALGDHLTVVNHDDRLGLAERRRCGLLEGVIEHRLQRRIGWLHHGGPGNFVKQGRRLRFQRLDVGLQEIRRIRPLQIDAAEPVVKGRTVAKQSECGNINGASRAVEVESEQMAQPSNSGTVGNLREHGLRI